MIYREFRRTWGRTTIVKLTVFVAANYFFSSFFACAQSDVDARVQEESVQSELVEGLLDLLNDPKDPPKPAFNADPPSSAAAGSEAKDMGDTSANPLASIRQRMQLAAGYLERGVTNLETQSLQGEIVQTLDDLISQLQEASNQDREQVSQQKQQGEPSGQQQRRSAGAPNSSDNSSQSNSDEAPQGRSDSIGEDNPGQRGEAATAAVQLADPRALQQSVWGQLPDTVRKQMQSKMVERFLPSYRQQIEAYFQALLKER